MKIHILLALAVISSGVHASPPQYSVTNLGPGAAFGVNNLGHVTGRGQDEIDSTLRAVLWVGTSLTDLDPGRSGSGFAVNASGQVAGTSGTDATRWTGTIKEKLISPGGSTSSGFDINASGQVAGLGFIPNKATNHAMRWTGTTATDLGTLSGGGAGGSQAYSINDSGQVAGWSGYNPTDSALHHAVRWIGTTATDLGTLGGANSHGYGINSTGQVVGYAETIGNGARHAVRWTGTTPEDLGTLGGTNSEAYAINDAGLVVGMSDIVGNTAQHAFLYSDGAMHDLSTLLLPGSGVTTLLINAFGSSINDSDQIAAIGFIGGQRRALLLTPTPEPASALLLMGGGAFIAIRRRKRPACERL